MLKAVLGLLALFPAVALFIGLVEIPPSVGKIIYLLSFFISVLAVLAIVLLTDFVEKLSNSVAVFIAALSLVIGGACLLTYMQYASAHVIEVTDDDGNDLKYLKPDSPSPELLAKVRHRNPGRPTIAEYQRALQLSGERGELKRTIVRESWPVMLKMLLLLIGAEVLLITPLVALVWKLAGPSRQAEAAATPAD